MPRVSKAQAEQNRESIEQAASRLFKSRGIQGVSVSEVMGAAGLTHGGFYGHFESKDELAALACARAFAEGAERWQARVSLSKSPAEARRRLLQGYLSRHPDDDGSKICPMVGFGLDVAREPDNTAVRSRYAEGVESLARILSDAQPGRTKTTRRRQGLAELALMVGTIVLSRALAGEPLGEEIVDATRSALVMT